VVLAKIFVSNSIYERKARIILNYPFAVSSAISWPSTISGSLMAYYPNLNSLSYQKSSMALRTLEKRLLEPLISNHGRSFAALAGWSMPSSRNLWDILKREQVEGHDARHIRDIWLEVSSIY
jgi:hypothetical protein